MRSLMDDVQGGVIARRQLRELHARDHDIRRLLRRKVLTPIHPGVYVGHTGRPTWGQRAWAAVLACDPAALTGASALPGDRKDGPIEVMVAVDRTVRAPKGVLVRRHARFWEQVDWTTYPPRQLVAEAAIDAAAAKASIGEAYALLAGLVQRRHVRAADLSRALRRRRRLRGRTLLAGLLDDLGAGACSVLEREYLRRVERLHGLPVGERQAPDEAGGRLVERDVLYREFGLVVELDGRAFHDSAAARDADGKRDLAAAVERDLRTVRLSTGQVIGDACATADMVGRLLQRGGWTGAVRRCPDCSSPESKVAVTR